MKKLIGLFLILSLVLCGLGLGYAADDNPDSTNVFDLWRFGGAAGITPPTLTVKVRYGMMGGINPTLTSGDVVVWDTNSADGYTISACVVTNNLATSYAGVLVTSIATATDIVVKSGGRNVGYMAIRGFALANVDTSEATTGKSLTPTGGTLAGAFGTSDVVNSVSAISLDCGVLLTDTAADGVMPVWLK